ncbi:serine O-acetyltransferase [Shewanella sp. SM95]|uniref:serine O-acetyltransferase n=1 Tax=Shewanella sp. SM95 TaxID=2912812 RepID=UPI0021D9FDF9|nr:serine O-acetyltransferase [Shewanella sp. SM95]MCU7999958.1 serine O-acetyltransferase [Shewanella sp. SM95]
MGGMQFGAIIEFIKSDLYRYTGEVSKKHLLKNYLFNRSFCYTFWFRLCKSKNKGISFIAKVMHFRLSRKYGIQIPITVDIGYGLYIGHGMALVLNPTVKIGNNCNLSQFTTIGSNHGKAATIRDNVYIGPNVCIVENVDIGNSVTIGAGSVITRNIVDNCTVAGVPAKVISFKEPGRYVNRRWPACS